MSRCALNNYCYTDLSINIQPHRCSKPIYFVGKRGICAQHRWLFDIEATLLVLGEGEDVLFSIVISTVILSLHA